MPRYEFEAGDRVYIEEAGFSETIEEVLSSLKPPRIVTIMAVREGEIYILKEVKWEFHGSYFVLVEKGNSKKRPKVSRFSLIDLSD